MTRVWRFIWGTVYLIVGLTFAFGGMGLIGLGIVMILLGNFLFGFAVIAGGIGSIAIGKAITEAISEPETFQHPRHPLAPPSDNA